MLTLLRAVSPPSDPAAVAVSDSVRWGWQAHRLDQWAERGRPGLLQLQQGDVIVKRVCIVILVYHDPLDVRHVFGTTLCQHAEVGAPVTWVRQSGGRQRQHLAPKVLWIKWHLIKCDDDEIK